MRRIYKNTLACLLSASIFCNGIIASAAETETFAGWNQSNREDAWAVYTMTDWKSMKEYLELDNLKSKTDAVNLSFRVSKLRDIVKNTLENMDPSYGMYKNTSYTNMILAIIQVLANGNPDDNDPCMVRTYIEPRMPEEDITAEKSIEIMMKRISLCEEMSEGDVNIYSKDKVLLSVVQGCITLPEYTKKNKEYTVENAQSYIDENKHRLYGNPPANFAQKFSEHYTAVNVGKQYQGTGDATIGQNIVNEAVKYIGNPYIYGGNDLHKGIDCSGFVKKIHEICGIKGLPRTSANQKKSGKEIADLSQALPGDVIGYSGHVAIYMGNNKIVHASNPAPYPEGGIKYGTATYRKIETIRRYW